MICLSSYRCDFCSSLQFWEVFGDELRSEPRPRSKIMPQRALRSIFWMGYIMLNVRTCKFRFGFIIFNNYNNLGDYFLVMINCAWEGLPIYYLVLVFLLLLLCHLSVFVHNNIHIWIYIYNHKAGWYWWVNLFIGCCISEHFYFCLIIEGREGQSLAFWDLWYSHLLSSLLEMWYFWHKLSVLCYLSLYSGQQR